MTSIALKPPWQRMSAHFPATFWSATLVLGAVFFAMRGVGVLGPVRLQFLLPLMCVLMVAVPCLLLTAAGRRQIGLRRAHRASDYLTGAVAGALAAAICFAVGLLCFGTGPDNWYVSIANSYRRGYDTSGFSTLQLHLMFTSTACIFSPLGEEIFFRGFLQRALEDRFTRRTSTHMEAAFFGLVHLCHHGIVVAAGGVSVRPLSGALWVLLMFGTAWSFAWLRQRSGSLWPAVLGHAAFNATMNTFIFAFLWA